MSTKLTYVPLEVAEQFGDFIIKQDGEVPGAIRARTRGYNMLSLLKLLYQIRKSPLTFSDLYLNSNIRMKKSFLNYLRLCLDYNFVEKEDTGHNGAYYITPKGTTMLDLFMAKSG